MALQLTKDQEPHIWSSNLGPFCYEDKKYIR